METKEQQRIITSKSKNILVIAGAGCGKTFTITKRVDYLINNLGVNKEDILVLSFTKATVNDIKKKLDSNIKVFTFHSLAYQLINDSNMHIISDKDLLYIISEYFSYISDKKLLIKYFKTKKYINTCHYQTFLDLVYRFLNLYKANGGNKVLLAQIYLKSMFNNQNKLFIKLFYQFINYYEEELCSTSSYDYHDLIIKASQSKNIIPIKYIIIDEFQDTSLIRLNLIKKIVNDNNANLMVVGDDYQSIYQFTGSNIRIFTDFKLYFKKVKVYKLTKTFRNSKELVYVAGSFIMKNSNQIKKELKSDKSLLKPIILVYYYDLKTKLLELKNKLGDDTMFLGRNNRDCIIDCNFYTIHTSKGLESDNVVIINNRDSYLGFPNKIADHKLIKYLLHSKETYPISEERRLFYVALTRTKNKVYLMVDKNSKSLFVKELEKDYNEYIEIWR